MKKIILFLTWSCGLFALSFGSMGNTSAGLGDSGVALRKSAWGIYYNPALLASDNRGKFGYSVGVNVQEQGLSDVFQAIMGGATSAQEIYDRFMKNPKHLLNINSQNGVVIQITGGTHQIPKLDVDGKPTGEMIEKRNPYGAFTMAAFASVHTLGDLTASMKADSMHVGGELSGVVLIEAPIGWGWRFKTDGGDVSIGAAIKYMGATGVHTNVQGVIDSQGSATLSYDQLNLPKISHWFGVDLGILYSPLDSVHFGLVAKNINIPSFDFYGKKFKIMPQVRFGISYEFAKYFALTFDADLTSNRILFENSPKTQMIGGGLLMDFYWVDLRFGLMGDMANKFEQGVIITGGINLLGFLDITVQASSKMFDVKGYKVPSYITAKIGGSFTF